MYECGLKIILFIDTLSKPSLNTFFQVHFFVGCNCLMYFYDSVATKIENGQKTNSKILGFLKMDWRRIRRIFVDSKILRRSSKIQRFSKKNEKFLLLKFSFRQLLEQLFPAVELNIMWGKLNYKVLRKVHIFWNFLTILSKILFNFPIKSSALNL